MISSYNGEKYVEDTILSAVNQDYGNFDVFIVNDKSTDNTLSIMQSVATQHKNVHLIDNSVNIGFMKSLNKIVSESDADYVVILGHDDLLERNHLTTITEGLDPEASLVHCNAYFIDANGGRIKLSKDDQQQEEFSKKNSFQLLRNNYISSCGILINKKMLEEVGIFYEGHPIMGEWYTWVKISSVGKVIYKNDIKSNYRRHETNITNILFSKRLEILKYYLECRLLAFKLFRKKLNFFELLQAIGLVGVSLLKFTLVNTLSGLIKK